MGTRLTRGLSITLLHAACVCVRCPSTRRVRPIRCEAGKAEGASDVCGARVERCVGLRQRALY